MYVPNGLHERIIDASERCKSLAGREGPEPMPVGKRQNSQSPGWQGAISVLWRLCFERMNGVEEAIAGFDRVSTVLESEVSQGMPAGPRRP